ncbi:unnamed protein product [Paramecium primaurelia]|uniref:Uncharacterized protein n=1 Tax=Paramecium primaurelia TaxID=5886 RepID=A0A8S1MG32_PARPR|nr:unnamed protein product [Paramecium primaurelia]
MGVYNLWKLLAAAGRNVEITSLRGLRVAIDVSIWMIKLLHGMSNAGVNYENVHLIGILKRIMFLLENGIKPVFVFDGPAPELKRQTLIKRAQQRQQYNINLQKLAEKYVVKLIEKGYDITQQNNQELIEEIVFEDESESQLPPEEQEIIDQQNHDILNLQFAYLKGTIEGFHNFDLQTKEEIIEQLIEERQGQYADDQNFSLKRFLMEADQKEKIKQIRIEAVKQIETLRVEKILEQYNDKESELLREYLNNNEDLIIKMGQFGVNNIYVYLQDQEKRQELVKMLYGQKKKPKRKLKDYEIENEHLKNIREALRRRYHEKLNEEIIPENQNQIENQDVEDLMDKYDCFDLDLIEQKMDEEYRQLQQIKEDSKSQQIQPYTQINNQENIQDIQNIKQTQQEVINNQQDNQNNISEKDDETNSSDNDSDSDNLFINQIQNQQIQNSSNFNSNSKINQESINQKSLPKQYSLKEDLNNKNNFLSQDIQQQFLDLNPKQQNEIQQIKPKIQQNNIQNPNQIITDEQIDLLFTQADNNGEELDAQEMIENIRKNQNLQSLDSTTMQQKFEDIRLLLALFGIPWIIAPGEAEAQCAYLQQNGLVDCVITEDSDVFLFGATKVLKGFFESKNSLVYYDTQYIKQDLGLNRDQLIYLALFLGSDYTLGIKGVGIVNAMEIVEVFDNIDALKRFTSWASKADVLLENASSHYENIPEKERIYKEFHKNYKKYWELPSDFPNIEVINEYKKPRVDESLEQFTWGKPAVEKIIEFCQQQLRYSQERIEETIKIPFQKIIQKEDQTKITDFFRVTSKIAIINSRRINQVVLNLNQPDQSRQNVQEKKKRKMLQQIKKIPDKRRDDSYDSSNINLDQFKFKKSLKKI